MPEDEEFGRKQIAVPARRWISPPHPSPAGQCRLPVSHEYDRMQQQTAQCLFNSKANDVLGVRLVLTARQRSAMLFVCAILFL